jgi:chromosome segregation ATPase
MKQQLEQRLEELRDQFESGQKMMTDLENQQINLRNSLLRISGAIQVLEELKTTESGIEKMPEKTDENPEIPASQ